jgi:uncharacterized membrane protein (UPF0136 family)
VEADIALSPCIDVNCFDLFNQFFAGVWAYVSIDSDPQLRKEDFLVSQPDLLKIDTRPSNSPGHTKVFHPAIKGLVLWLADSDHRAREYSVVLVGGLVGIAVVVRVALVISTGPTFLQDSAVYTEMAKQPLFSSALLLGLRPCLVPLLYKICGLNGQMIIAVQALLSACCWGALCVAVSQQCRLTLARVVSALVITAFSFTSLIVQWDALIMSESVFFSLMALHLATWFWFSSRQGWLETAAVIFSGVLWTLSRDTAAYTLALLIPLFLLIWYLRRQAQHLVIALAFASMFAISCASSSRGERWLFPFFNVLSQRVLPDETARRFFSDRGMPMSQGLLNMSGKWALSDDWAYYNDPRLEELRRWVRESGRSVYIGFLGSYPTWTLTAPSANLGDLVSPEPLGYLPQRLRNLLSSRLESALFPTLFVRATGYRDVKTSDWLMVAIWMGFLAVSVFVVVRHRRSEAIVPFTMILLAYPMALIIWHGDAMEILRHALQIGIGLRLATWLLLLIVVDCLLYLLNGSFPERSSLKMSESGCTN